MRDESEIKKLRDLFQENSVLKFTYEMNINNKLPFLDVLVQTSESKFKTSVYHKPSDQGTCLNETVNVPINTKTVLYIII